MPDFSFCRVFDTAVIIAKPTMMMTPMIIQINETPNLLAVMASPAATNKVPIRYIAKFDILILH